MNRKKTTAKNLAKKIISSTLILKKFPEIGTLQEMHPTRNTDYRYILSGRYKLIYFVSNQFIVIATIFDTRQDPEKLNVLLNENY